MNKTILWRVLRFNNISIRFFIWEGNPFFDASDIMAVSGAGMGRDLKTWISVIPQAWRINLLDNGNEIVAISPAGALMAVLASTSPDIAFFEWLTHAPARIAKGIGRRAKSTEGSDSSIVYLQLLRGELERELCAVDMTLGEIRRLVWEHSHEEHKARVFIAEAMERKSEMRGAAFSAISALGGGMPV